MFDAGQAQTFAVAYTAAWNTGRPDAVAALFAPDGVRAAGSHGLYLWTFTGTHAATQKSVEVPGWEEWDMDAGGRVKVSRGWFDANSYARQTTAN